MNPAHSSPNGDSQSRKAFLDGRERKQFSILRSKFVPWLFSYFGILDDGSGTLLMEIERRKPQACRTDTGNGSAHGRDEQIQLAFIHCDEQNREAG